MALALATGVGEALARRPEASGNWRGEASARHFWRRQGVGKALATDVGEALATGTGTRHTALAQGTINKEKQGIARQGIARNTKESKNNNELLS